MCHYAFHDMRMASKGLGARSGLDRGSVVLALAAVLVATSGSSAVAGRSTPFNYCADQNAVFRHPRPFVGISDLAVQEGSEGYRNCSLGRMAATGLGYFRGFLAWQSVEPEPSHYNVSVYDAFVADLARHHMKLLAVLAGAPKWRSTAPSRGALAGQYPPASPAQFAYFASLMVMRYGPGGAFWRANPTLPYYPVRAWQVWNEPDLPESWEPHPNMSAYDRLLRAASTAIKGIDSHAIVVTAGMPFFGNSDETHFISNMYRYGARGFFDVLAIHAYSATVAQAEQRLWTARRLMDQFGDRSKPLWVTEFGWAGGDPDGFITNFKRQRASVTAFFRFARRNRGRLLLREAFWFGWQDHQFGPGAASWWGYHLGLFTIAGRPKPALAAMSAAARQLDR